MSSSDLTRWDLGHVGGVAFMLVGLFGLVNKDAPYLNVIHC